MVAEKDCCGVAHALTIFYLRRFLVTFLNVF